MLNKIVTNLYTVVLKTSLNKGATVLLSLTDVNTSTQNDQSYTLAKLLDNMGVVRSVLVSVHDDEENRFTDDRSVACAFKESLDRRGSSSACVAMT